MLKIEVYFSAKCEALSLAFVAGGVLSDEPPDPRRQAGFP